MSFRYIGSKSRVVEQIGAYIGYATSGFFVDAFCGTGVVAEFAAELGWPIRLNDHLTSATNMAAARLISVKEVQFRALGGYDAAISTLNKSAPRRGFIWRQYSPASSHWLGFERRYFTEENAARIDGIRAQIAAWRENRTINRREELLLVADLLGAVNRVANIAGTYGCFLSSWIPQAGERLMLRRRDLKTRLTPIEISNVDALKVRISDDDLVYLDPPYTKRQYASYYHILETISKWDEPVVEGVSGLRPWRSLASDYCYKVRALKALTELISRIPARRILLSYSDEGHIDLPSLGAAVNKLGSVQVHELASIGRYRPNQKASAGRSCVREFLMAIHKKSRIASRQLLPVRQAVLQ